MWVESGTQKQAVMNTIISLLVAYNVREFLYSWSEC
jgi:hypothetical protein